MTKVRVGIMGGAGYTGGELLRILLHHPLAEIVFVHSNSQAGKAISSAHGDLIGESDLFFTQTVSTDIDVLFLCVGHGEAARLLEQLQLPAHIKIIDLSHDHRLNKWVYGLPELNKNAIANANKVANPGCFATCIQLALLPLASRQLLWQEIHVSATTGSTGAGQKLAETSHFSWRNNNLSVYKAFEHQHLGEIYQSLRQLQTGFESDIAFLPFRGSFTRGILSAAYTYCNLNEQELQALYADFYADAPFVVLSAENPDLKQVVNTNKCVIYLEKHKDKLLVISAIDNLTKGASGQAVQNMNLMFNLPETTGLWLKPSAF
jgi:N-acetyl-gamma-glutamyl-phosphate reductase